MSNARWLGLGEPYHLTPVAPACAQPRPPPQRLGWTSHQLAPTALAHLFVSLYGEPPRLQQLAIGAEAFALGSALSKRAESHLAIASAGLLEKLPHAPTAAD
ncbi:MAG: hypothetical protein VBE63_01995 [Lamprobacter sp.]|uniref:hypothetical protein n=1 Tax=Lamprobacter sp. TaxID=3100796 RepID=UPI002B263347|nr:hypothetical protein [Lamprobacter sp.]MEA3638699.1 hypothetical protein [Lamprobacter sp.]